jgi:putative FmdB family regulatory protein
MNRIPARGKIIDRPSAGRPGGSVFKKSHSVFSGDHMPTYEFECRTCSRRFSTITSMSKKCEIACPQCSGRDLREFFGVPSIGGKLANPSAGSGGHTCSPGGCSGCGGSCKG